MSILFHDIIYGPVRSRRFGYSLGMNLLPSNSKICTFNCIYCECGWNPESDSKSPFVEISVFLSALEETLKTITSTHQPLDVLTYAGNGEPTLHPKFSEIAYNVFNLRNKYAANKSIVLLTNGTTIANKTILQALDYIDIPVFKIDSGKKETINLINQPNSTYNFEQYIQNLKNVSRPIAIQTMLLKGLINNQWIDNTSPEEVDLLIETYHKIKPMYIMLYSLDRKPPLSTLQKIDANEMMNIARKIENSGLKVKWV